MLESAGDVLHPELLEPAHLRAWPTGLLYALIALGYTLVYGVLS